jgi:hypothetical protein
MPTFKSMTMKLLSIIASGLFACQPADPEHDISGAHAVAADRAAQDQIQERDPGRCEVTRDTLYSAKDASVDQENWNTGLGSEVRLYYQDALAFLTFEGVAEAMAGKKLVKAELLLNAWTDGEWPVGSGGKHCALDLFLTQDDWVEGTGHWYWHGGGPHNNYAFVYSLFPAYVPPAITTDPEVRSGITWENSGGLRAGLIPIGHGSGFIPKGRGTYPLLGNTGRIAIDLTKALAQPQLRGRPLALALRLASGPGGTETAKTWAWIYSKDHVSRAHAPQLVLAFRSEKKQGWHHRHGHRHCRRHRH